MKRFFVAILFSISALALDAPNVAIGTTTVVHVGFLPVSSPVISLDAATKICQGLSKELGVRVEPILAPNYSEMLTDLVTGKADFAFLSSVQFVEAEKSGGVKVLLKKIWKEPFYYSTLLTLKDSKIKSPKDLKGRSIAFVDKKSSSGYLYPHYQFVKMGLKDSDFSQIVFSGSHSKSVSLLEQKKVEAIAVFSDDAGGHFTAWDKFKSSTLNAKKIWISEPIPNEPFCVRTSFYEANPKLTHSLMFAMIDVVESLKNDPDVAMIMGGNGFMPATSRQYDSVREMVKVLGPVEE